MYLLKLLPGSILIAALLYAWIWLLDILGFIIMELGS
jgi:hypothetical protein